MGFYCLLGWDNPGTAEHFSFYLLFCVNKEANLKWESLKLLIDRVVLIKKLL